MYAISVFWGVRNVICLVGCDFVFGSRPKALKRVAVAGISVFDALQMTTQCNVAPPPRVCLILWTKALLRINIIKRSVLWDYFYIHGIFKYVGAP